MVDVGQQDMKESGGRTPDLSDVDPSNALWRKHVGSAFSDDSNEDDGMLRLLLSGKSVDDLTERQRESMRPFCLRGHELSGVRRGALRSSAEEVVADALKFRSDDAIETCGSGVASSGSMGERQRLNEAVTWALSLRCVVVDGGGTLHGVCGEDGETELSPEEREDTVILLRGGGRKSPSAESSSSLVSKMASMKLGNGIDSAEKAGEGDHLAAAAKFLGSALQSHLGGGGGDSKDIQAGAVAVKAISEASSEQSKSFQAPSAGITSRVFSGAFALGSYSYRLAAGAASYAARATGIIDEGNEDVAKEYCTESGLDGGGSEIGDYGESDDGNFVESFSAVPSNDIADDDLAVAPSSSKRRLADLGQSDRAVSSAAVVRCCAALLRHAESRIESEEYRLEEEGADPEGAGRILLGRTDDGVRSFRAFCRSSGEALSSSAITDEEAAYGRAMTRLGPADVDLLVLTLLSSRRAAVSPDGDVLALYPSSVPLLDDEAALGEVDVALFKMRSAMEALERRAERLTQQLEAAATAAVRAKRSGASRAAIGHIRRRKLLLEELDRCSTMLLNLEAATQGLCRAKSDARALKCYEMAAGAMKLVRAPEEEGGMGLSAERVEEAAKELAEEMEEVDTIGGAMAAIGEAAVVVDEEELLKELSELESEVDMDSGGGNEANQLAGTIGIVVPSRDDSGKEEGISTLNSLEGKDKENEADSRNARVEGATRLKVVSG